MESLQTESTRQKFALACSHLWDKWLERSPAQRELILKQAILNATAAFMPPPKVKLETAIEGAGSAKFEGITWICTVDSASLYKDIQFGEFTDLCGSVYHESRHAEQYFRMAQGLASGQLENPKSKKKFTSMDKDRFKAIAKLLAIHEGIARVADNLRADFKQFAALPVDPAHKHAVRGWADQVEEWLECLCSGSREELTIWAEDKVKTGHVSKILYDNLPVEADAYCIEWWEESAIKDKIDPCRLYQDTPRSKVRRHYL